MTTIKQLFANLIMEINETFEKIYQAAEENKIFESVYNEFGKLDSLEEKLSPKLKALLAAGLIGTASLGMQSCAQPTDDYTNPAPTEEVKPKDNETPPPAPAPTDNTTTNPTRETPKEETEEEKYKKTICGQLGISKADADLLKGQNSEPGSLEDFCEFAGTDNYIYENGKGFVKVEDISIYEHDNTGCNRIKFESGNSILQYCIPEGTEAYSRMTELRSELSLT